MFTTEMYPEFAGQDFSVKVGGWIAKTIDGKHSFELVAGVRGIDLPATITFGANGVGVIVFANSTGGADTYSESTDANDWK